MDKLLPGAPFTKLFIECALFPQYRWNTHGEHATKQTTAYARTFHERRGAELRDFSRVGRSRDIAREAVLLFSSCSGYPSWRRFVSGHTVKLDLF